MSNVIEREPSYSINAIQRGAAGRAPVINNTAQLRNNKEKLGKKSRNAAPKSSYNRYAKADQLFFTENSSYQVRFVKRNIFVSMLELGLLSTIMKYLPIKKAASLKALMLNKALRKKHSQLQVLFEREFLRYLDAYRCHNPNIGGKKSLCCRLITMYYL